MTFMTLYGLPRLSGTKHFEFYIFYTSKAILREYYTLSEVNLFIFINCII